MQEVVSFLSADVQISTLMEENLEPLYQLQRPN